jgi:hypothetical protein
MMEIGQKSDLSKGSDFGNILDKRKCKRSKDKVKKLSKHRKNQWQKKPNSIQTSSVRSDLSKYSGDVN